MITGGARSGKSRHAETRALALPGRPVYLATAEARDAEMRARISKHIDQRGDAWRTLEVPLDLCGALDETDGEGPRLLDCLTLWLTNVMLGEHDIDAHLERLCAALTRQTSPVIVVTNEVGSGIVPDNALARRFRDEAGRANQRLGDLADEVVLVVAGQALRIKPAP